MKKLLFATAVALALPSVAHAQEADGEMECCEKMEAEGKECCCKDMEEEHAENEGEGSTTQHNGH